MKYQSISSAKKPGPPTKPKPKNITEKEPVQVFCRLRPLKNLDDIVVVRKINDNLLELSQPNNSKQIYKFNNILDDQANQRKVFDLVALPLVKDLINGQNGLIFSYGVTSSGKTYTITGTPQEPGILPRTLDTIFNTLDKNNLQTIRYIFKPDHQNGFEIIPTPDAIIQLQTENLNFATPSKTLVPKTPRSMKKRDLGTIEWENRVQENFFINEINCDNNYSVFISYIEVYNNYIYDLLDDSFDTFNSNGTCTPRPKRIMEDNHKRYYVQGVKEVEVKNSIEAFDQCIKGMKRRRIGITQLNSESSRSHSVFNIRLVQAPLDMEGVEVINNKNLIRVSQLSIVDLAGCERTSRTQATGNRLREASNINNSLLTLRNCFDVLRENQKFNMNKMVPYRENKLTHLFKSYFEGDGKVEMIICINPSLEDLDETLQVCKFAEISQELTTNKGPTIRYPIRTPLKETNLTVISNIAPPFPNKFLEDPDDELILSQWIEIIEKHQILMDNNIQLNKDNQRVVRERIVELQTDYTLIKQQNSVLQMDLEARESQLKEYENKISHMQRNYDDVETKLTHQIRELQDQLFTVQNQASSLELTNEKIKIDYNNFKNSIKESWKMECKRLQEYFLKKIKEKELEMEKKIYSNQEKLDIVKKILDNDEDIEFIRPIWMSPPSNKNNVLSKSPEKIETDTRGPPVVNPRYRRSLSCGDEKWIEHRPPGTLELGTVFQPNIKSKKKKSVTNLKASDFVGNGGNAASKYALTHHQATECGEVETQVFKGQVIPSATGGAQVIFNDVERLVQSPPEKLNPIISRQRKRLAQVWEMGTNGTSSGTSCSSYPSSESNNSSASRMTPNKRFKI